MRSDMINHFDYLRLSDVSKDRKTIKTN
jgi:hypothetical protein